MELYAEILAKYLSQQHTHITFPSLHLNAKEIVNMQCYQALCKIKAILEDDSMEDDSCFERIEQVISAFEDIGSSGGSRHDFG